MIHGSLSGPTRASHGTHTTDQSWIMDPCWWVGSEAKRKNADPVLPHSWCGDSSTQGGKTAAVFEKLRDVCGDGASGVRTQVAAGELRGRVCSRPEEEAERCYPWPSGLRFTDTFGTWTPVRFGGNPSGNFGVLLLAISKARQDLGSGSSECSTFNSSVCFAPSRVSLLTEAGLGVALARVTPPQL